MTEKQKVCDLVWQKIKKDYHPELKKEGIEYYSSHAYGKKKFQTKREMKKILSRQIEGTKYYLAQQKKNWEIDYPNNLKWYYAETKNYFAVGWLLKTQTEKSLKKDGIL